MLDHAQRVPHILGIVLTIGMSLTPSAFGQKHAPDPPAAQSRRIVIVVRGFFRNDDPARFDPHAIRYGQVDLAETHRKLASFASSHLKDATVEVLALPDTRPLLDCQTSADDSSKAARRLNTSLEVLDRIANLDVSFKDLQQSLQPPVPLCKGWRSNDIILFIAGLETKPRRPDAEPSVAILGAFWFKEDRSFAGLNIEPYDPSQLNTQGLIHLAEVAAFPD